MRTAMGRAFMQIAAVFAEMDRARIRERIQTTLDLERSQNLITGNPLPSRLKMGSSAFRNHF